MKKELITILLLLIGITKCYGYELILPREKKSYVNSQYAFFIGKANSTESISINDKHIYTAPNGAFAHSVKLKNGENRIVVRSNFSTQIYKIYKDKYLHKEEESLVPMEIQTVYVKNDNTPLRSTPVDGGLNRMSHLFSGTTLLINGSKGNFYRVFLSKDTTGWIAKKDVEFQSTSNQKNAEFINMSGQKYKNAVIQTISFTKNLPYTVEERDKEVIFKIYNPELSETSVYTLNIPKPEKYAYKIMLENGLYTFKVVQIPEELSELTVVIDAGHGGSEKGAIGCLGDEEKNINLKIAFELENILKSYNINTLLTRECDGNISLQDRVNFAKINNADIFISIHLNSIGDIPINIHKHRGTSVYYYNKNSKELAEIIEKSVTKHAGTPKDGVRTASFAVIRPSDYVSILIETAYMTNPIDSVLYRNDNFAKHAAEGIAEGILKYINDESISKK